MKTLTQFLMESKLPSTGDKELDTLLQKHQSTGRVAHVHPMKKLVSLNGSRPISYQDAKKKLKESYDPMSLDYSNKNISKKELLDIIRHFKSINKIDFYKFVGKVNGKKTVIKGMGDWFQTFVVDGKSLNMPMGKSERTLIQYLDIAYGK